MKIGILTFHRAHNYGAVLQSYALAQTLQKAGHEVEFIDYRLPQITGAYRLFNFWQHKSGGSIRRLKAFLADLMTFRRRFLRRKNFTRFIEAHLKESARYGNDEINARVLDYDAIIFGSDQIWTWRFLGRFEPVFWGNINIKPGGKKIAYAPSMEMKVLSSEQAEFCAKNLRNFDSVSVRERQLCDLLQPLTEKNISVVLDPTLLCCKDVYSGLSRGKSIDLPEKYILVYQIMSNDVTARIATKIAGQLNIPIIELGGFVSLYKRENVRDTAGPVEFIDLIRNATFIVTTSFHGTALSVIYEKPFYAVAIPGIETRILSVLELLDIADRAIWEENEINPDKLFAIDYDKVDNRLEKLRRHSLAYIFDQIG